MAHETRTAESTAPSPGATHGRERQLLFAGGIVFAFLLVGVGIGVTGRFGLGYIIGLFDAGANPTANQYVGIVFLVSIFVLLMSGALLSGIAGLVTGLSFRSRWTAATIGGGASLIGFFLLTLPALLIMVSSLGGGSGAGGPSLPLAAVGKTAIAAGFIGATTAAVGSVIGN